MMFSLISDDFHNTQSKLCVEDSTWMECNEEQKVKEEEKVMLGNLSDMEPPSPLDSCPTSMSSETFVDIVLKLFSSDDSKSCVVFLEQHQDAISDAVLSLISGLATVAFADDESRMEIFTKALCCIAQNCPKDALVCILEAAEGYLTNSRFTYLLKPLLVALFSLPERRPGQLKWAFGILSSHLKNLPVPGFTFKMLKCEEQLVDKELKLEKTNEMKLIMTTYDGLIDFYKPFVSELSTLRGSTLSKMENDLNISEYGIILKQQLLELLRSPLAYLYLQSECGGLDGNEIPRSRLCALKIMELLSQIDKKPFDTIETIGRSARMVELVKQPDEEKSDTKKMDDYSEDKDLHINRTTPDLSLDELGLGIYSYLLFHEGLNVHLIPSVLLPREIFYTCLPRINFMLAYRPKGNTEVVLKGVLLAKTLLSRMQSVSVSGSSYQIPFIITNSVTHNDFINPIINLILFCENAKVRQDSLICLKYYLGALTASGRYKLLSRLFINVNNDSLRGYLIGEFKNSIVETLVHRNSEMMEYFVGENCLYLLSKLFILKDGSSTDLLSQSDCIMALLNLLRFLLIRDGRENGTGFLTILPNIKTKFLDELRSGIRLLTNFSKMKLKKLENSSVNPSTSRTVVSPEDLPNTRKSTFGVHVMEVERPNDALKDDFQATLPQLKHGLSILDLLESCLSRVDELMKSQFPELSRCPLRERGMP